MDLWQVARSNSLFSGQFMGVVRQLYGRYGLQKGTCVSISPPLQFPRQHQWYSGDGFWGILAHRHCRGAERRLIEEERRTRKHRSCEQYVRIVLARQ